MNIIIPLGGIGERFKKEDYIDPKPLINIYGKPMIFHVIDKLDLKKEDNLIIIYNNELKLYNFDNIIKNKYQKVILIELNKQTEGAAETILIGLNKININLLSNKCVLLDCDSFYNTNILQIYREQNDNAVFCFRDIQSKPLFSYIKFDENKKIIDIKEKQKISNFANTGCYCFINGNILKKYCKQIIDKNIREKNEYYTSCVIKEMLNDNHVFYSNIINYEDFICVGTPFQLKLYCSHMKNYNFEKKRFCFDLDNTIVTFPHIKGDYTTVKPNLNIIEMVQNLKNMGHTIIIYTARRMKTHNGNVGSVIKDIGKITIDTLSKFDVPYDELIFGKPYADFYIDDLAINPYHNLEKQLGFYKNNVQERNFNEIKEESINIIKKYSKKENNKLKGEIHYYLTIPNEIKQFFPSIINYGDNWYSMEKINGITFSYIFLDESLSDEVFLNFLNVLYTINSFDYSKLNIDIECDKDIYENYCNKIRKRYSEYDYTKFENSSIIYEKLIDYFDTYEKQQLGRMSIIHGDMVFSNCIIDENNNFKFIDMRGILGNKLTIFGDVYYDYAKVYQSLIGYDEILLDKLVSNNYRQNKIKIFETFVSEKFGCDAIIKIKMITNSLLFTLIPLHDDNKCIKYFNLINL